MSTKISTTLLAIYMILCCPSITHASSEENWSPRDYDLVTSQSEADDIKYVVTTMGNANNALTYVALLGKRGELKTRGDRIDNVHPLRFLACVFNDEQMKVSMRNIQKNMTWKNFLYGEDQNGGLAASFNEEANRNNLRPEQIHDFTDALGVNFDKYYRLMQNRQWETVVVSLIQDVPRKGDYRRNDY